MSLLSILILQSNSHQAAPTVDPNPDFVHENLKEIRISLTQAFIEETNQSLSEGYRVFEEGAEADCMDNASNVIKEFRWQVHALVAAGQTGLNGALLTVELETLNSTLTLALLNLMVMWRSQKKSEYRLLLSSGSGEVIRKVRQMRNLWSVWFSDPRSISMAHFVAVAGFDALPSAARIEFADIYDDATERLAARLEDEISARQSFAWAPVLAIARFVVQGPVLASGLTGAFETVRGWVNPAEPSNLT